METEQIKSAVREVLEEKSKEFWIDRETHYKQHEWLGCAIKWAEDIKSTTLKALARCVVYAAIGLMLLGFVFWGSKNFKG
jgi:hypothetical protein